MKTTTALRIKAVNHRYNDQVALRDINLEIEQGFTSIIGPNGSGKTTLIKLTSGLLDLQDGCIDFDGISIRKMANIQRARLFTIVQQKQFFPFPFTCLEMVGFGRYPHRKRLFDLDEEDHEIMIRSMKITDTLHLKDKLITEVSGGEQQRVVLACALAQQPKILFLDEAFASMDIAYQASLMRLLKKLVEEDGLIVVSIVHDLNLAYRYSDAVCIMKKGQVCGFGPPQAVMTKERISDVFEVKVDLIERRCFYIDI